MRLQRVCMGSGKRIPCSESTFEEARDVKDDLGMTWDQLISEKVINTDAPMQESMQVEIDADEFMDRLRDELDDLLTVQVDVDLSDESDLSEEDVKRIVRDHIERRVHERARNL